MNGWPETPDHWVNDDTDPWLWLERAEETVERREENTKQLRRTIAQRGLYLEEDGPSTAINNIRACRPRFTRVIRAPRVGLLADLQASCAPYRVARHHRIPKPAVIALRARMDAGEDILLTRKRDKVIMVGKTIRLPRRLTDDRTV